MSPLSPPLPERARASAPERLRARVWEILEPEREDDRLSRGVDLALSLLIVANVVAVVVETMPPVAARHGRPLAAFEAFSVAVFTAEYLLRLWACTTDPRFTGRLLGRLRYGLRPMLLVDLLAIVTFYLPMLLPVDLRILRVLRLLRIFKLARYSESLRTLLSVFRARAHELAVTLFAGGLLLLLASAVMYQLEHEQQPEVFGSIPAAMWWGVVTLTTVGYGDACPTTPAGRAFAGFVAVLGIGIIALPAGILAGGFSDHMSRRREAEKRRCPHCDRELD